MMEGERGEEREGRRGRREREEWFGKALLRKAKGPRKGRNGPRRTINTKKQFSSEDVIIMWAKNWHVTAAEQRCLPMFGSASPPA